MLYELKEIRRQSGLTQIDAAERLGVSINTYRNWEQLKAAPRTMVEVRRVADFFGVTMEDLFGHDLLEPGALSIEDGVQVEDKQLGCLVQDYKSMNDDGRRTLCRVARALSRDPQNAREAQG